MTAECHASVDAAANQLPVHGVGPKTVRILEAALGADDGGRRPPSSASVWCLLAEGDLLPAQEVRVAGTAVRTSRRLAWHSATRPTASP